MTNTKLFGSLWLVSQPFVLKHLVRLARQAFWGCSNGGQTACGNKNPSTPKKSVKRVLTKTSAGLAVNLHMQAVYPTLLQLHKPNRRMWTCFKTLDCFPMRAGHIQSLGSKKEAMLKKWQWTQTNSLAKTKGLFKQHHMLQFKRFSRSALYVLALLVYRFFSPLQQYGSAWYPCKSIRIEVQLKCGGSLPECRYVLLHQLLASRFNYCKFSHNCLPLTIPKTPSANPCIFIIQKSPCKDKVEKITNAILYTLNL